MRFDPDKYHRRSIRLPEYDYSQAGAYFVTLVAQARAPVFGHIVNGVVELSDAGKMVQTAWLTLPGRYHGIELMYTS